MARTNTEVRLSLSDVVGIIVDKQQVLGTGLCNYRLVRFLLSDGQQVHIAAFATDNIGLIADGKVLDLGCLKGNYADELNHSDKFNSN